MIKCVLTDIEGTTSSIEFVHKVLFPYSRENFYPFLMSNKDPEIEALVFKIWTECLSKNPALSVDRKEIAKLLQTWVDEDRKEGSLKTIQGRIWKQGFEAYAYYGHMYSEVKQYLEKWKSEGLRLAIYSSGSVEAQKLLFKHSSSGDLSGLITDYFDTEVGHKREATSYRKIAERLEPSEILFLSDISQELDAAATSGFQTCQLLRDPCPTGSRHPAHIDFVGVDAMIHKV